MNPFDGRDVLRLLLLEATVQHLIEAGVIDEDRVLDGLVAELAADLDEAIDDAETDAGWHAEISRQLRHACRRRDAAIRPPARDAAAAARAARALDDAYRCLAALRRLELET